MYMVCAHREDLRELHSEIVLVGALGAGVDRGAYGHGGHEQPIDQEILWPAVDCRHVKQLQLAVGDRTQQPPDSQRVQIVVRLSGRCRTLRVSHAQGVAQSGVHTLRVSHAQGVAQSGCSTIRV